MKYTIQNEIQLVVFMIYLIKRKIINKIENINVSNNICFNMLTKVYYL